MYAYAVLLPEMAKALSLSLSTVFGILSLGLFFGGLLSPVAGALVDRFGGRYVMGAGSLAGVALMLLSQVEGPYGLFFAILLAEGAGVFVLYNVAFASVARLDSPVPAARAISIITLFGGVASTIFFWPVTLALHNALGWQATWVVLGAMVVLICRPVHLLVLRQPVRDGAAPRVTGAQNWLELIGPARRRGMIWMVLSFIFSGYLMGAVMTLWVTNVQDLGHTAAMAAFAGAVIGPFKAVGRFFEMLASRNMYPRTTYLLSIGLMTAGFAVLLIAEVTLPGVILAAALYGMGDGIKTIARGTLPLALFGARGYGARLGWISFVQMGVNASAPFAVAWITQTFGGWWSFAAMGLCLCAALATFPFIPDPRRRSHDPAQDRCLFESAGY